MSGDSRMKPGSREKGSGDKLLMSGDSRMKPGSREKGSGDKLLMSGDSLMKPGSSSIAAVKSFLCLAIVL